MKWMKLSIPNTSFLWQLYLRRSRKQKLLGYLKYYEPYNCMLKVLTHPIKGDTCAPKREQRNSLLTTFPIWRSLTNLISPIPGLCSVQPPRLRIKSSLKRRLLANLKLLRSEK